MYCKNSALSVQEFTPINKNTIMPKNISENNTKKLEKRE
jgi:hypothetical protein